MSTDLLEQGRPPTRPTRPVGPPGRRTWSLSLSGLRTVAVLELRQRVRSTRWFLLLVPGWWCSAGSPGCLKSVYASYSGVARRSPACPPTAAAPTLPIPRRSARPCLSGRTMPSPSSCSWCSRWGRWWPRPVGHQRQRRPQRRSAGHPAGLAAHARPRSWSASCWPHGRPRWPCWPARPPFIVWALVVGGLAVLPAASCALTAGHVLLVVCAIGLGWSAVAARTASSAVLTYLTVAMLGLGLPLLFALCLPLTRTSTG